MKLPSLLPADTYTIIKKSLINEEDKKNIISLYEPLIGPVATSLYFTLLRDISLLDYISIDFTHHHLMVTMKSSLDIIRLAKEALEGVGLLKTYFKEGEPNSYVYELYAPLTAKEFLSSPIFNIALYDSLGALEYEKIKKSYEIPKINLKEYQDITVPLNYAFKSSESMEIIEARERNTMQIRLQSDIDFDLLETSLPSGLLKDNTIGPKTRNLIEQLSFIYGLDTLKMSELVRHCITDKKTIDKEQLRKIASKYYQYNHDGKLPSLIYKNQPESLRSNKKDNTTLSQLIYLFENTSPYDFLKIKYKGVNPTTRDLKLIETLLIDLELEPAVINVLIDFSLKKNNNKLTRSFVETIAGQWKRSNVKTAEEAMKLAREETESKKRKSSTKHTSSEEPTWFNQKIEKEELTQDEQSELEEMFKKYR